MGDRKQPTPPPGSPGYAGPVQFRPNPPPPPPAKRNETESDSQYWRALEVLRRVDLPHMGTRDRAVENLFYLDVNASPAVRDASIAAALFILRLRT